MRCRDVGKRLSAFALDEVDLELRREIHVHLDGCARCRSDQEALAKALAVARSSAAMETSQGRRDLAARAMTAAFSEEVEHWMIRRRSPVRWWLVGAAAVLALVWGGFTGFGLKETDAFRVAAVQGHVSVQRGIVAGWSTLNPGDILRTGDRVITGSHSAVQLQGEGAVLALNQRTSIFLECPNRGEIGVSIDRGEVYGEISGGGLRACSPEGDVLAVSSGKFVLGLREPLIQRVPNKSAAAREPIHRLEVRVAEGHVRLKGSKGEIEVTGGQMASVDLDGYPRRDRLKDDVFAPWVDAGYFAHLPQEQLSVVLDVRAERDANGRLIPDIRVQDINQVMWDDDTGLEVNVSGGHPRIVAGRPEERGAILELPLRVSYKVANDP